jgi:hypothetical protein
MKLKNKIEIYVPEVSGLLYQVDRTVRILSALCGGATETSATGSWVDDSGKLITDQIHLVYAYYNNLSYMSLRQIVQHIHELKVDLKQELISVTFAGSLHLI